MAKFYARSLLQFELGTAGLFFLWECPISIRLFLFRHAKAQFAAPGMRDFDRPLEDRGIADATTVGAKLASLKLVPERVICSTGLRARQTWEAAQSKLQPKPATEWSEVLYNTDAAGYLNLVHQAGSGSSLMLVGHNPMMEDLALALAEPGDPLGDEIRRSGFPTAGLVILEFDSAFEEVATGRCRIIEFLRPGAK